MFKKILLALWSGRTRAMQGLEKTQEDAAYDVDAEQVHLFKRLGICGELAKTLCSILKRHELSQYVDSANIEGSCEKIREIQYQLIVLAEALSAGMMNAKRPSNEILATTLEWVKEQSN